jgi:thiamine-phosphate pyrophosphorylase
MAQAAGRVVTAAKAAGIPVLINDRIDVALATDAAGVHVGQDDMPVATVRKRLPDGAVIGLTVRSMAEADAAPVELLDYISIGGVFPTLTKNNPTPPLGLDGLGAVVRRLRDRRANLPLCAIAGIDHHVVGGVMGAGVDGVAVVRAVFAAPDPVQAVRALRIAVNTSAINR